MARQKRVDRLERELASLESEFRSTLVHALRGCAKGSYGLFGQNDHILDEQLKSRLRPPELDELLGLGTSIDEIRGQLGKTEPFQLLLKLRRMREVKGANVPGEPRLAKEWLAELGEQED